WYGSLIALERAAMADTSPTEHRALVRQLDSIEESVNAMKMPLAYADQFYVLREHIGFVRARLAGRDARPAAETEAPGEQETAEPQSEAQDPGAGEHAGAQGSGEARGDAQSESGGTDTGERTH